MIENVVFIIIGLIGLYLGGNWLVQGASRISSLFGVSPLIIGLTVVAIGTSAPELVVSIIAAFRESGDLAVGNLVGSNIANIGLILGVAGVITPISVKIQLIRRHIPILMYISVFAYLLVVDGELTRNDGVLLLYGFASVIGLFIFLARTSEGQPELSEDVNVDDITPWKEFLRVIAGTICLILGAELLVRGASAIASSLGVSELVIGMTMVAFGTSLPELITAVIAALRKESDILVGNIIGSNIANLLLILGITSIIKPTSVPSGLPQFEFIVLIIFSILMLPFALDRTYSRRESFVFLTMYLSFIGYSFLV